MKWVVLAFCLITPLAYNYGVDARLVQEMAFQVSSILLIGAGLLFGSRGGEDSKNVKIFNALVFSLLAWCVFLFMRDKDGFNILFNLFLGIGVYLTVSRCLKPKDIPFVIKGICWVGVAAVVYMTPQFLGWDIRGMSMRDNPGQVAQVSLFFLEAHYGVYLAMVLPLLLGISFINDIPVDLSRRWRTLGQAVLVSGYISLLLLACWFSKSSAAMVALFTGLLLYLWFKKRIFFWITSIVLFIATSVFVFGYDSSLGMHGSRLQMWQKVISDSFQRPFGYGLDSFRMASKDNDVRYYKYSFNDSTHRVKKHPDGNWLLEFTVPVEFVEKVRLGENPLDFWDNPHNELIQVLFEFGQIAFLIVCAGIYFIWRIFKESKKTAITTACFCSLVAVLISSQTHFPFHVARLAHLVPIVLGMFIHSVHSEETYAH